MLPVNCGSHADYQNFVVTNLRKYYPNPNALARSTWDIIERFWNLNLSFTDTFMADKYSKFGPTPQLRLYKLCPRAFLRAPAQRPAAPAAFGCSGGLDRRSSDFCSGLPFDCAPFNNLYVDSILFLDRSQKNRSGCSSMARRSFFCVRSTRL